MELARDLLKIKQTINPQNHLIEKREVSKMSEVRQEDNLISRGGVKELS